MKVVQVWYKSRTSCDTVPFWAIETRLKIRASSGVTSELKKPLRPMYVLSSVNSERIRWWSLKNGMRNEYSINLRYFFLISFNNWKKLEKFEKTTRGGSDSPTTKKSTRGQPNTFSVYSPSVLCLFSISHFYIKQAARVAIEIEYCDRQS